MVILRGSNSRLRMSRQIQTYAVQEEMSEAIGRRYFSMEPRLSMLRTMSMRRS
jgi:hypothetical protein